MKASILATLAAFFLTTPGWARDRARPTLIVAIVVDQYSSDLFGEYRQTYRRGLRRLAHAVVFPSGYQSHAATETCPGHSTILTGDSPARTGIIANNWTDARVRRGTLGSHDVYCAEDEIVANGGRADLAFVIATLQPYDGIEAIYPMCMDVVDRLDDGDELLRRVSDALGETGVVSGEFGHVEAEGEQHGRLARYLEDPRPRVRAFALEARRHAEHSMAWEQRRAEQDVEQMRRDWD